MTEAGNKDLQVWQRWDREARPRIAALIDDELIAEHAAEPEGHHSDQLERVLGYFRRAPVTGKYLIVATEPWQEYRIARMTGERGREPTILDDQTFATEEQARHGVFLRRVEDLRRSLDD